MSTAEKATIDPNELAQSLSATWADVIVKERRPPSPHAHVYASSWRACTRRMVYDLTSPDQTQPWSADTLANFKRGQDREREMLIDLTRVGRAHNPQFEVIGQQERFTLKDRNDRVVIAGKVDCRIKLNGMSAPVETKSWSQNTVSRIKRFEDLFSNVWTRSGAYQLLSYLYGSGEAIGFLVLDRHGLPLILPVVLFDHLDAVEEFLNKASMAVSHREQGTLPDFIDDPGECKRCSYFGTICQPPIKHDAATVLTDPELIQMLERRSELEATADEFDGLDQEVKKRLRGVEQGIAGPFALTGKWQKQTTYAWPEDLKLKYGKANPKGKFVLTITKT